MKTTKRVAANHAGNTAKVESKALSPTASTALEEKRKAIYADMSIPLRKVADSFTASEMKIARGNILARYDMGVQVKDVLTNESKFESGAALKLAAYMNVNDTDLYDLRAMVTKFTREEAEALAQRVMPNGKHISVGHLLQLARVGPNPDRKRLIGRIFGESLTVNQLGKEVAAGYQNPNRGASGRRPARPTSPIAGVQQVFSLSQKINNLVEIWDHDVFSKITDMSPVKVDKVLLKKLEDAETQVGELVTNAGSVAEKLNENIERVRTILAGKADDAAPAEEPAVEPAVEPEAAEGQTFDDDEETPSGDVEEVMAGDEAEAAAMEEPAAKPRNGKVKTPAAKKTSRRPVAVTA